MNKEFLNKWLFKIALFSVIGVIFWLMTPKGGIEMYWILVAGAAGWLLYEYMKNKTLIKKALMFGLFLMVFDWIVENIGAMLGFWISTNSLLFVAAVPIEIMLLATLGGAAWVHQFPKKLNWIYTLGDALIFASFGMIGEYLLKANNQMIYMGGWTSLHAFVGYFGTWILISLVWYKVISKKA